ncbi:Holliday junction branch migration protein RuvA [Candidatus Uhrbacteria bacterium CG_4_9_14_3_um_filter_41_35]|uniref:Holliday junction branch migration complex subunit RuvA n=1 Tax=Candidatus Uhrbacteria bacterium CG_4_9_14_3_um_filter_41_35 TaxID=1975034 RepID=A0A2M7XGE3_9BACT|nr:MAG: Holliday junction branch migration protein RuvA [Candidatus Uhrbacteria bacterium CG11_big_fil_rev_8_21_14_0_20_41_9]PJA46943.1 MAG: Holliday junction branch migration protein RuvA [Candidatus Uhrbacteria bacterium CG_4_9_14_3_um_filter_41_35]
MIAYLEGEVISTGSDSVVLKTGGVGYRIYAVDFTARTGDFLCLFIFDLIREDRRELFGFKDAEALNFFEKLIEINGVGPKSAQKIMSVSSHETLRKNILNSDLAYLTSLPGLGKKTAQKIILEMKGVLVEGNAENNADVDVLEALIGLGYQRKDIIALVQTLEAQTTEDRIREALNKLGMV